MAKRTMSVNFKNAILDSENMILTEVGKDFSEEFSLLAILQEWDGIEGVSFSLKQESGIPSISDGEIAD